MGSPFLEINWAYQIPTDTNLREYFSSIISVTEILKYGFLTNDAQHGIYLVLTSYDLAHVMTVHELSKDVKCFGILYWPSEVFLNTFAKGLAKSLAIIVCDGIITSRVCGGGNVFAVSVCLCVCLSVCLSVCSGYNF